MAAEAALGVAASAAQLFAYGTSILLFLADLYERARDAPTQYLEYQLQLKLLVNVSRAIEQNPVLQIPELQVHLDATLIDIRSLQSLLCSPGWGAKTYWYLVTGREQRKILEHLENLQKKNTGLLLCVCTVNTSQLSRVQDTMANLHDIATAIQRGDLTLNSLDNSQQKKLVELLLGSGNEDNKSLVRRPIPAERMAEKPSDLIQGSKTGGNRYDKITITGSKFSIVDLGNTSRAPKKTSDSCDVLANVPGHEYIGTSVTSDKLIFHAGNVGGVGLSKHKFGPTDLQVSYPVVKEGDFETLGLKKEWQRDAEKEFEKHGRGAGV